MRVIAGRWRSRVLVRPDGGETRPMPDRVKEAIFDILGIWFGLPGRLPPITVADVFAGSGGMGLEALSRGAELCYFLERSPRALAALRRNLGALKVGPGARVLAIDAWRDGLRSILDRHRVDLLFLDPPYCDTQDPSPGGKVGRFLAGTADSCRVAADAMAVLHHEAKVRHDDDVVPGWQCVDRRQYGTHGVTFFRRIEN